MKRPYAKLLRIYIHKNTKIKLVSFGVRFERDRERRKKNE